MNSIKTWKIVSLFICCIVELMGLGSNSDTMIINQSGRELNFKMAFVPLLVRQELRILAEKFVGERTSIVLSGSYALADRWQYRKTDNFKMNAWGGGISIRRYSQPQKIFFITPLYLHLIYFKYYSADEVLNSPYMVPFVLSILFRWIAAYEDTAWSQYDIKGYRLALRVELGWRPPAKFFHSVIVEFSVMPGIIFGYEETIERRYRRYEVVTRKSSGYGFIPFPTIDVGMYLTFLVKR